MKIHGVILIVVILPVMIACKQKKKESPEKENFFPVLSFIQSQVAHVDTSLYSIMKIVFRDSLRHDTTYVRREDFRAQAKDFLEVPDLSSREYANRFTQEKLYDETMNRVIWSYKANNPEKEEIQKEEVLITPNVATGDKVNSIIIIRVVSNREGFLQKNMLWRVDKSFQVVSTEQKTGQPEMSSITEVIWNEDKDE